MIEYWSRKFDWLWIVVKFGGLFVYFFLKLVKKDY